MQPQDAASMTMFADFVKFLVPALSCLVGAVTTAAVYSWRLSSKLTSFERGIEAVNALLVNKIDKIQDAIAADARVRDERDLRVRDEHKYELAVMRKDLDAALARVASLEAAHSRRGQ